MRLNVQLNFIIWSSSFGKPLRGCDGGALRPCRANSVILKGGGVTVQAIMQLFSSFNPAPTPSPAAAASGGTVDEMTRASLLKLLADASSLLSSFPCSHVCQLSDTWVRFFISFLMLLFKCFRSQCWLHLTAFFCFLPPHIFLFTEGWGL